MANDSKPKLSASSKAVDPTLAALFAESAKPVVPPKCRYTALSHAKSVEAQEEESEADADEDEDVEVDNEAELSALATDGDDGDDGDEATSSEENSSEEGQEDSTEDEPVGNAQILASAVTNGEIATGKDKKRKRKNRHDDDDQLESRYLAALADDDDQPTGKRQKGEAETKRASAEESDVALDSDSDSSPPPVHESLTQDPAVSELEKASRTIFISNVSSSAITSRSAKKTLVAHLSSILDKKSSPPQTIESIRFRSTAFAAAGIPKRAAYIKKSVMDATTRSTNAYVVYSHPAAVRAAVQQLNGTVVLDRHIRVDSVAHPAPVAHRRCVFVGNLGFVDDETVLNVKTDEEGKEVTEKKKRTKAPMDVEEGLWRVFGEKAGKVESVRVVRDAATRVGKGFAYVQFYDENAVETALLLAGKKFPPMLPRELRVSRCKAPHKTARALEAKNAKLGFASSDKKHKGRAGDYAPKPSAESQTLSGRTSKLLGRSAAAKAAHEARMKEKKARRANRPSKERRTGGGGSDVGDENAAKTFKSPEDIVFEGRRASVKDGKPKDLKFKGSKNKDPRKKRRWAKEGRAGQRAAKWRSQGGKRAGK